MTIKQFTKFFESKYPLNLAQPWDNCGLIFDTKTKDIKNVIVTLDLSTEVMDKAIKNKTDLIITHHPFIWPENQKEQFEEAPYKESIFKRLENTGIAVYGAHTNFDVAPEGMGDTFIKMLGFEPLTISGAVFGKMYEHSSKVKTLQNLITKKIGITKFVSNIDNENMAFSRVAILPGTGMIQDMMAAQKAGVDVIVTADVKWSTWVTIKELGINVIQVTHGMEDVFTNKVSELLMEKFKDIEVLPIFAKEFGK